MYNVLRGRNFKWQFCADRPAKNNVSKCHFWNCSLEAFSEKQNLEILS